MKTKMFIFTMLAVLLVMPMVFAANNCTAREDVSERHLQARYEFYYARAERIKVGMDAVIDYADENGYDSAALQDIEDSFTGLYDDAKTASDNGDKDAFDDVVKNGKDYVKQFRETAKNLTNESEWGNVAALINSALSEQEEYLDGLLQNAVENRKGYYLHVFDVKVCNHQMFIDRLEEKSINVSVSSLQEELDAISAKRDDLVEKQDAAFDACYPQAVAACDEAEAEELTALIQEINDDFKNLKQSMRDFVKQKIVARTMNRLNSFVDKEQKWIDGLKSKDFDTTALQAEIERVREMVRGAGELNGDDDSNIRDEVRGVTSSLRELHKDTVESYKEMRREGIEKRAGNQQNGGRGNE